MTIDEPVPTPDVPTPDEPVPTPQPETPGPRISPRKLAANRVNANKSTGPRSPEGKRPSSQNALRTGIYARRWLIPEPGPERRMFEDLFPRLETEFPAEDLLDEQLHEDFAVGRLRLWRFLAAETGSIMAEKARAAELDHTDSL